MSRFDGVVACEIPKALRSSLMQRVITPAVVDWICDCLRARCPNDGKLQQSSAVIATSGNQIAAFFGTPFYYSHPVMRPEAAHYSAMVAESSGFREFILTAKFDRTAPNGRVLFTGDELERIAEYPTITHDDRRNDSRLLQLWENGDHDLLDLRGLLTHPRGGTTLRQKTNPRIITVVKQFRHGFGHKKMLKGELPKGFERWCKKNLQRMLENSRSDGKTRPGRKAHAACVVAPDGRCVFACNSPSDVPMLDCCSERAAARIAVSASILPFALVAITSDSYPGNGSLEMCDFCKATFAHHIYDGNTLVLYFEKGKHPRRTWLSRVTRPYAFTDDDLSFTEPHGNDGYF